MVALASPIAGVLTVERSVSRKRSWAPHHDQILPQQLHPFTVPAGFEFRGVHDGHPVVAHELTEGGAWANSR
jgi:hypothetical protein